MKKISIKLQLLIFLWCFLLGLSVSENQYVYLLYAWVTTMTSVFCETCCLYYKEKKWRFTESSWITGIILGCVLSSDISLWLVFFAAIVSISAKHLIRFKQKHIFNPAALGIFMAISLGGYTQWKGAYLWYVLIPVGFYFAWKIKKIKLVISFLISFVLFFIIFSLLNETKLTDIMFYLNCFFVFIMLTEPKTSPILARDQLLVGGLAGFMVNFLYFLNFPYDAELIVLLFLNVLIVFLKNSFPLKPSAVLSSGKSGKLVKSGGE